jgi:hypothetical protein
VLVEQAKAKGYDAQDVKAGVILAWLKEEYDLGRGHGMALVHVINCHLGGDPMKLSVLPTACGG